MRARFGPSRQQGARPTCLAFALSDAHRVARASAEDLSPEHLYFHAVQRTPSGHPAGGVNLVTALDALRHDGQCAEIGWPYLGALPKDLGSWAPPATASPIFCRASAIGTNLLDDVIGEIEKNIPVLLVVLLSERFYRPINSVVQPGPGDRDTAYHALIAVGLGRTSSERMILVRNSWGTTWGSGGYCWVADSYLRARLHQTALIT
jgi:hypothetical protein